jgi:hypothetical protein
MEMSEQQQQIEACRDYVLECMQRYIDQTPGIEVDTLLGGMYRAWADGFARAVIVGQVQPEHIDLLLEKYEQVVGDAVSWYREHPPQP